MDVVRPQLDAEETTIVFNSRVQLEGVNGLVTFDVQSLVDKNFNRFFVRSCRRTCIACPAQWSGETFGGATLYMRYRFDGFQLDVNDRTVLAARLAHGNGFDGDMSDEQMKLLTSPVLDWNQATWT